MLQLSGSVECAFCQHFIPNGYDKLAAVIPFLQNVQNLVLLHSCCAENGKEMSETYNAHVQLLFYSLNLLFGRILIAVAVLVC